MQEDYETSYSRRMTGAELAAGAAMAAGKVAAHIAEEQKGLSNDLRGLAANEPGMRAAASAFARRQAVKQELLLGLYKPLASIVGVSKDYFDTKFGEDLADKMADVPEGEARTPRASVAGPAMQGLGFSLDEPALKDMYLELLARASDERSVDAAHPSFVDVIRQLTAAEAEYLPIVFRGQHQAVVHVSMKFEISKSQTIMPTHLVEMRDSQGDFVYDPHHSTYVDNWMRLGLITCDYTSHLLRDGAYDWVEGHPVFAAAVEAAAIQTAENAQDGVGEPVTCEPLRGIMAPTSFGEQFARVVGLQASDPEEVPDAEGNID